MTQIAEAAPVIAAYIDALKELGRPVGNAIKPDSPAKPPASFYPYFVVYGGTDRLQGSLVEPKEDGVHRIQVTTVAKDAAGAEAGRDRARAVLCDRNAVDITGHDVVWTDQVASPNVTRDDDVQPAVFYAVLVVNVLVTPTGP